VKQLSLCIVLVLATVATACSGPGTQKHQPDRSFDTSSETDSSETDTQSDGGTAPNDEIHLAASRSVVESGFSTALNCADCHSNDPQTDAMRDSSGDSIGMYDLWGASMMANSARDPFWRGMVAHEVEATPAAKEAIEDKCMNCHAPQAYTAAHAAGNTAKIEMLHDSDARALLGLDGVSCTTCHKIEPDNFGQEESFSGGFVINPDQIAYGPFANPFSNPMINRSGFEPVQSNHVLESEMCATCHNLTTDALTAQGHPTGDKFAEQAPYSEWLNSAYNTDGGATPASCQSCHVPQTDGEGNSISTEIARRPPGGTFPPTSARQPVGRHLFIGGNTLVPGILRDHADALQPQASAGQFDALIAKVRDQLRNRTATVSIKSLQKTGDGLSFRVALENLAGHKFPTSFPSRRAWLHVTVRDAQGNAVFESGAWDTRGRILGGDGEVLAIEAVDGPIEPHHDQIDSADQVQIYEPVMADPDGNPTYVLLRAAKYYKDNRLLPKGWSSTFVDIDRVAPVGVGSDSTYLAGTDEVTYTVAVDDTTDAFTVEAELVYQVLGARFAAEIFESEANPTRVFEQYYDQADVTPELIGRAEATVQ
jgi:hypothetical protein